jgi:hypothetical protein
MAIAIGLLQGRFMASTRLATDIDPGVQRSVLVEPVFGFVG